MRTLRSFLGLLVPWVLAGCECGGVAGTAASTLAIECYDEADRRYVQEGLQVAPIDLERVERVRCRVDVRGVPLEAAPTFLAEPPLHRWRLDSDDGGQLYFQDTRPVRWSTWTDDHATADDAWCRDAQGDPSAAVVSAPTCDAVCCLSELGAETMPRGACGAAGGTAARTMDDCRPETTLVCCELPYEYPEGAPASFPGFVPGDRQLTSAARCGVALGEPLTYNPPELLCNCCEFPDGHLAAGDGTFTTCSRRGAERVPDDSCWPHAEVCGSDGACQYGFCALPGGATEVRREDACRSESGTFLGVEHDGQAVRCCGNAASGTYAPTAMPDPPTTVAASAEAVFRDLVEGTVVVRLEQLASPPLLFAEAFPGSSAVTLRVGLPPCGSPAFAVGGRYSELYNCAQGGVCIERQVPFDVEISPGDTDGSYVLRQVDGPWRGEGILCDRTLRWTAGLQGDGSFFESGVWVFPNPDEFLKSSDYGYDGVADGACTGRAVREGRAPREAPWFGPCVQER